MSLNFVKEDRVVGDDWIYKLWIENNISITIYEIINALILNESEMIEVFLHSFKNVINQFQILFHLLDSLNIDQLIKIKQKFLYLEWNPWIIFNDQYTNDLFQEMKKMSIWFWLNLILI